MSLQLSPENKAKLSKYITEAVGYLQQVESLNEDLSNLASIAKEEMELPLHSLRPLLRLNLLLRRFRLKLRSYKPHWMLLKIYD